MTAFRALRLAGENVRFALGAIFVNRLRSFLTLLGIVIGVATVIIMAAIVDGFRAGVVGEMTAFGATLVQFQKYEPRFGDGREPDDERERRDLTYEDALAIKRLAPSIAAVSPERYLFPFPQPVAVRAEGREVQGPIIGGVVPDYMLANNHFVTEGRFVSDADVRHATEVAVVGPDVVKALWPGRDPLGRTVDVGGRRFTVIGVFESKGRALGGGGDSFVMVPFTTFDRHFPWVAREGEDPIHIATVPRRPEWVERAVEEGTAILRARRGLRPEEENDFAIFTPDKLLAQMGSILLGISVVLIFIASVSLVVGGVGVMNVMLVAVTERTREIGLRMALGARKRDVVLQFLTEAVTLTLTGGVAGILIGVGFALVLRTVSPLPAAASAPWMAAGLGVSVAVGLGFGLYPAVKAARLDPIEALRHE